MSMPHRRRSAGALLLYGVLGACHAPERAPLDSVEVASSVSGRDASPAQLRAALELAGLQPFALVRPDEATLLDPRRAAFWHACAWAWSPATRAARRRLEAARARAGSAGKPGPIRGALEMRDLEDPDANSRVMLTFDLLGLLGVGPAAAARDLADVEIRSSLAGLEEAMWNARFEVDAARVQLAAVRSAQARLRELHTEANAEAARIEILERHGRLAEGTLASARLVLGKLADRLEGLASEEARARAALALAAGLAPDAAALDVPGPAVLSAEAEPAPEAVEPTSAELLKRVPMLRSQLVEYALSEARLREAASRRWPSLALGPHLFWGQPEFLIGAVVNAGLPWPGSLEGEVAAASVEREAARERVEDALLAIRTRLRSAREREAAARDRLERGARPVAEQSARLWTAARARFAIEPAGLESWAHALGERFRALEDLERARAAVRLAALDVERATGPAPATGQTDDRVLAEVLR